MPTKIALSSIIILVLGLTACNIATLTPSVPTPNNTEAAPTQALPTSTQLPATPSPPPAATDTTQAAQPPAATSVPVSNPASSNYIDDRSTPSQVLVSYYNAINRQEYSRAYGYYTNPSSTLGSFAAFQSGYADTVSVDLVFGQITSDSGMSQTYFTVPVILKAATRNGAHTNYAACYIVHQSSPGVFSGPGFQPMSIDRGQAKTLGAGAQDSAALATACSGLPAGPNQVAVGSESLDFSKDNFIDNRSGPIETVRSLFNSINLKQYARAYYYFDSPVSFPGNYNSYAAGYNNTEAITATFGTAQSEGAAGSTYYKVPVGMVATTTSNSTETFVGCFTLRLAQPLNQAEPPFHPLAIVSGHFTKVDNGADINSMLPTACQ
jgi:hypothetical protein